MQAMIDIQTNAGVAPLAPHDLRLWDTEPALARITLRAITEFSDPLTSPATVASSGNLKALLAVLTYCYASGIYCSAEIEQAALRDPLVRYLAVQLNPGAGALRAFRRRSRLGIQACLVRVFALACRSRFFTPEQQRAIEHHCDPCAGLPQSWVRQFLVEAEQRIQHAVHLDSMEMDV